MLYSYIHTWCLQMSEHFHIDIWLAICVLQIQFLYTHINNMQEHHSQLLVIDMLLSVFKVHVQLSLSLLSFYFCLLFFPECPKILPII